MRAGLLILGDHLPNPHTGVKSTSAERHRQIVDLAVRAEALGFDLLVAPRTGFDHLAAVDHIM